MGNNFLNKALLVTALGIASAVPAHAVNVVLTFDPNSQTCTNVDGGSANQTCSHLSFIGADYGSTPELAVSYDAGGSGTSLREYLASFYPNGGAFNLASGNLFSDIVFTPAAGYEVSLLSWFYTNGSATAVNYFFEVRDDANNLVASHTAITAGTKVVNTDYYSGPLTFRFRNEGGGAIIDNITLDVRQTATPGAVPEPASWAMMIGGFGLMGGFIRKQGSRALRFA